MDKHLAGATPACDSPAVAVRMSGTIVITYLRATRIYSYGENMIPTHRMALISAAVVVASAAACPSFADDDAFLEVDPATIMTENDMTLQQWLAWSAGHTGQRFTGFQSVTEFDYGLTSRLQLALNLEYDWQRTRDPLRLACIENLPAISAEAIYAVIPAEAGHFGLSLAFDPAVGRNDRGFAFRVLMQRNLAGFESALDIGFQDVWTRDASRWTEGSAISVNYGIAFPLTSHWTVSFEANNERGFDGLFPSRSVRQSFDTYFAGPTLQYDCEFVVVTLGVQAQLPWATGDTADGGYTPDAERFRTVLRFAKTI